MNHRSIHGEKRIYHIRLAGNLDDKWADWFEGFAMSSQESAETWLSGEVADQAALHGVLGKINSLGLTLLMVLQTECPCTSNNCVRRKNCAECADYHAENGKPYCFRERTKWNKQCMKLMAKDY